ncbi:MAG: OB-fold nucleic acid binding domain-containing protein [Dermatophilaceae bacterium]|nr:OB-fold nucleic acid binding domain-containing protein [Intrasporangiaceae bacterium]
MERIKSVASEDDPFVDDGSEHDLDDSVVAITDTVDRQRATVQGRVRSLTLPTTTSVTALVVEIADQTGPAQLVFVGRKAVPGIRCGVTLRAHGRMSIKGGHRIVYNPAYEIVPRHDD